MMDIMEHKKRTEYLDMLVEQIERIKIAAEKLRKFRNELYDLDSEDNKVVVALDRAAFLTRGIEAFVNEVMLFQRDLWKASGKTDKECSELLKKQFKLVDPTE